MNFKPRWMNRRILRIAIPAIVSNITVPLLGLIDLGIVGHLDAPAYIGAIAIGSMIFNLMYWLFGFLRMGTSGMTSQALGRRDLAEDARILVRSFCIAAVISLAILLFQLPIRELTFLLMQPDAHVRPLATTYFNICIWGALGTIIAQWSGFLVNLLLCMRYYGKVVRKLKSQSSWLQTVSGVVRESGWVRPFFKVNSDIFVRTLFLVSVNMFFTSAGSWQGEMILAVNSLLLQFLLLFSYFMDGFAYAGEALCGKYLGAHHPVLFTRAVRYLFVWGLGILLLFMLVYGLFAEPFLTLLTNQTTVIAASRPYQQWLMAVLVAGTAAYLWDGIYIGTTSTRQMLGSAVAATVIYFIVYYLFRSSLGNHALWLAYTVFLLSRSLYQTLRYPVVKAKV